MNYSRFSHRIYLFVAIFVVLLSPTSVAQERSALLLFKSSEEAISNSRVATKIEPILKSLGLSSTYHDVDQGLPKAVKSDMIVSWFSTPKIANPEEYVDWMAQQIGKGKKVVILGNFGAHTADGSTWLTNESLDRFFYPFGVSYGAAYSGDSGVLKITRQQLPATAPEPLNYYLLFRSVNPSNKVLLEVERTDLPDSKSALVVQTPFGAMAQESYVDRVDLKALLSATVKAKAQAASTDKKLLGLYKSSEGVDARTNFLARFVAPTLFDLGYGLEYHDIDSGLPPAERMNQYQGVISWYLTPDLAKAGDYIKWLTAQIEADRRVIILGNFGAFAEDVPTAAGEVRRFLQSPEYNTFFYPFGLEFRGAWTAEKKSVKVGKKDSTMMTWLEPGHVGHYYWIRSVDPNNQEYLTVTREGLSEGESAVVVATPKGGLALESYVLSTDPKTNQPRMHFDLKKFLAASLTLQGTAAATPKPDVTALRSKAPLPKLSKPTPGGDGKYPTDVTPIKRKILAFYQSSIEESGRLNHTFLAAQMVLEHLGMVVVYHDLDSGTLPTLQEMEPYRGIVLWLGSTSVPNARQFDSWLRANVEAGRKLALLGDYQIREKDTLSPINPQGLYAALGVHYDPLGNAPLIQNAKGVNSFKRLPPREPKVVAQQPGVMDFEKTIDWRDIDLKGNWHLLQSMWPESEIGLTVAQGGGTSDVVVLTKTGGLAVGPFAVYDKGDPRAIRAELAAKDNVSEKKAQAENYGGTPWRLNPFHFFGKVFEAENLPKPDVTTLNGSRIYYSHIDGDAYGGLSHIDYSSINGEMMYKKVIKDLPLPITVSYVTRDVEQRLDEHYSRELEYAQAIFKLPNVEPASHTYSHPFDWERGDLALDPKAKEKYSLVRRDIDLNEEISHSINFVDKLCPPDKRCQILLWSGKCNPKAEALELVRQAGVSNMNGGEPTFDSKFPFLSGVFPLYGDVNGETQYHVSAAGDFYYTASWTGDYDGMKNLPDYFERTESPRRLRCLNVYYHFYLAEKQPGIDGLKIAYDDVLRRSPAPMFASEYTALLRDALETKIGLDSLNRYWFSNTGKTSTLRLDAEKRYPDLVNSLGVIGFNRLNDSLYVHLDGSGNSRLALAQTPPKTPYLIRFTQRITNWKATKEQVSFLSFGQGPSHLEIANLDKSSLYRIETPSGESTVRTDAEGVLIWNGRFDGYQKSHTVSIRKVTP